jgi:phosphate:Na+ symporter
MINQSIITIGMLIGGLGLFLLAMNLITDGLKLAAGNALHRILKHWTRSPVHGILSGLSITALVQSSSAVTVATIGFVNAGLISLYQALGIIYGTNIGTTMTAWLVAIVGFKINVEIFALPLIGVGMLLRLTGSDTRRASLGLALAGFGLFFIGIDVLKDAFEGIATTINLEKYTVSGVASIFIYVGVGFLMTVLTQSSSAAIAITLTAVSGGVLGLYAAAAMVIGSNVGTTSTAALAVIGATPNAKRVAAAHVIFNFATGIVALAILPILFWVVKVTGKILGLADVPAITLALFHTVFNVLGVLLMFPLMNKLTYFLKRRFITQEELAGRPQYLDKNVVVSPKLALNALTLELSRITIIVKQMALKVLSAEPIFIKHIAQDHDVIIKLSLAIDEFIERLEREVLTGDITEQIAMILRAQQHILACAEQAHEIAKEQITIDSIKDVELSADINRFRSEVITLMKFANIGSEGFYLDNCERQLEKVQQSYDNVKASLLNSGAQLRARIPLVIDVVEQNSHIRRMARQMLKALRLLDEVYKAGEFQVEEKIDGVLEGNIISSQT